MRIVAAYSYKGGTGRTLLLANLAVHLAKIGLTVMAIDLDLEAPGLHYKLTRTDRPTKGVIDFLCALKNQETSTLSDYLLPVEVRGDGQLWMLPAGSAELAEYWKALGELDLGGWARSQPDGPGLAIDELLRQCEVSVKADVVLIDARTGVTDSNALGLSRADHVLGVMIASREHADGTLAVLSSMLSSTTDAKVGATVILSRVPSPDDLVRSLALIGQDSAIHKVIEERLPGVVVQRLTHDPYLREGDQVALDSWSPGQFGPLFDDYIGVVRTVFADVADRQHQATEARVRELVEALHGGADLTETEYELLALIRSFSDPSALNALAFLARLQGNYLAALSHLLGPAEPSPEFVEVVPALRWLVRQAQLVPSHQIDRVVALAELPIVPPDLREQVKTFLAKK